MHKKKNDMAYKLNMKARSKHNLDKLLRLKEEIQAKGKT